LLTITLAGTSNHAFIEIVINGP